MRATRLRLFAGMASVLALTVARTSAAATFTLLPASPSSDPTPDLGVSGLPPKTTVTVYRAAGCSGVAWQTLSTGISGTSVKFSNIPVTKNASNALSVKVGFTCATNLRYVHDDIAPSPPKFSRLDPAAPNAVLRGTAEAGATLRLYTDASCTTPYLGVQGVDAAGNFAVTLPASSPAARIYAKAADAALNVSACTTQWVAWAPEHAQECPGLPADVPISRPSVYAFLEYSDQFFGWKDECHGSRATCPPGGPRDQYFSYLEKMQPALVQTQGGSPAAYPFAWGMGPLGERAVKPPNYDCNDLADVSPNGTPYAVYGNGNFECGVDHYQEIPYATPDQLKERAAGLKAFVADWGAVDWAPYTDFGTQLYGDHVSRNGLWNFWDNYYDQYEAAGWLGPKPEDPTHWLLRVPSTNTDLDHPTIADLSFLYPYYPAKYARYSVDPINKSYQAWQHDVFRAMGKSGLNRVMVDNVGVTRCWNDDCAAGFSAWLPNQPEIAIATGLLRRTPPSLNPDAGCETWLRDAFPPFDYTVPNRPWAYGNAIGTSTLVPSTDAYSDGYSCKLTTQTAGDELQVAALAVSPGSPAGCDDATTYHTSFHYKSDVPITYTVYVDYYHPLIQVTLPASPTWTSSPNYAFGIAHPQGQVIATTIATNAPGTLYTDDLTLAPDPGGCVGPAPADVTAGLLSSGNYYVERARATMTNRYWNSLTDGVIQGYVDAARAENPKFNVALNDVGYQYKAADWSIVENVSEEIQRGMWDQGVQPGNYPAGHAFNNPATPDVPYVLPNDTVMTNAFTLRNVARRRLPAPFAYQLHVRQRDAQNTDTALLQLAEDASYAGGAGSDPDVRDGYFLYTPAQTDAINGTIKGFFDFSRAHADLYQCARYAAEVGVVHRAESTQLPMDTKLIEQIHLFQDITASGLTADVFEAEVTPADLSRLKVLVLDHVHRISESEALAINGFVAQGGVVIATKDSGVLDDLGRYRDAAPVTAWQLPGASAAPTPNHIWVVPNASIAASDVALALKSPSRPNPSAFPTLSAADAASLRLSEWTGWDKLVVHLLNYKVPRGVSSGGQVSPRTNLSVTVPIPADAPTQTPHFADFWSPEGALATTPVTVQNGMATFVVPSLRVYTIASLR